MKKYIFTIFAVFIGILSCSIAANAQSQPSTDLIKLYKTSTPTPGKPDTYTIKLDSYVTGTSSISTESMPADIVLVLDVSGSMSNSISTGSTYNQRETQNYSYNSVNGKNYFVKFQDKYYKVNCSYDTSEQTYYYLYYSGNDGNRYLKGTDRSSTVYTDILSPTEIIYTGRLYKGNSHNNYDDDLSYNTVKNNTGGKFYYLRNKNYYEVKAGTGKIDVPSSNFRLYIDVPDEDEMGVTRYYLSGNGAPTTTEPAGVSGAGNSIWKGVLYESEENMSPKIDILKDAVKNFIDIVADDALNNDVDHRISIIKYAGDKYANNNHLTEGDTKYYDSTWKDYYNYSQLVKNLTLAGNNKSTLTTSINNLSTGGATAVDYGLNIATEVMGQTVPSTLTTPRSKVVVMFTDGEPNHNNGFDEDVADDAIQYAATLKAAGCTVYTIGVLNNPSTDVNKYMNGVSSNYPNASSWSNMGDPVAADEMKYYKNATNAAELKEIFKEIAEASVADTYPLDENSVSSIDVVSDDFELPAGFTASSVSVHVEYAVAYDPDHTASTDGYTWKTWDQLTDTQKAIRYHNPDPHVEIIDPDKIEVNNFYYALDDVFRDGVYQTYGNWVGLRNNDESLCAGAKLVYEFNVELKDTAIGGYSTPTNEMTSGIYIDVDGTPTLVKAYPLPLVDIPAICIIKSGLTGNDTAIFNVDGPSKTTGSGTTSTTVNYDYRVMLTKLESDKSYAIIRNIPDGQYTVSESDWSWTYTGSSPVTRTLEAPYTAVPSTKPDWIADDAWTAIQAKADPNEQLSALMTAFTAYIKSIQDGATYADKWYVINNTLCLLFEFSNTSNNVTVLQGEDVVRNIFGTGGGSAEHGGVDEEEQL